MAQHSFIMLLQIKTIPYLRIIFQSEAFRHTSMNALYVHVLRASGMFQTFLKDEFSACQQESVLNPRVGSYELLWTESSLL